MPVKIKEQTLKELLRDVFEITKTGLGPCASLNAVFRAKGLHGRLLAVIFSHVPTLHAQLPATSSLARHRLEDISVGDLTAHQFRALLAHYYGHTIRTLESETWPEEFTQGMDPAFLEHFREIRDQELVEMAATMVELETGSPSARKITAAQTKWEHISLELSRVLAEKAIAFPAAGPWAEPPDVIARVRMAFILTLLGEEAQSTYVSTLHAYLRQVQDLGDCGIDAGLLRLLWFLPSQIPHDNVARTEDNEPRGLDFTSLEAIVGLWKDLLQAPHPHEVAVQLAAANWNSALRLLKGDPPFFESLKNQILQMVRLQMPFAEILESINGQERVRLPFGMEVLFRNDHLSIQKAVASEILTILGSQARYPLLFIWQEHERRKGSLELVDARPAKTPANGPGHETAVEMILLRVFRQIWGITGQPNKTDFHNPARLMEAVPGAIKVEPGIVEEIKEELSIQTISAALTRLECALDRIILPLPQQTGYNVKNNICELRRLISKRGARKMGSVAQSVGDLGNI